MANYFQSLEKRATTLPGMTAVSMLLDAAKVAGFDKAVYGLKDTETRPVLY